ncbi:MAG: DUF6359 domain-containing protein [Bacteroidales bacterium]
MISFSSFTNVDDEEIINPDGGGEVVVGDGSEAKPFSVEQAIKNQNVTDKWIEGYVVGAVSTADPAANEWQFAAPFATPSNILIASKAGETDKAKLIAVQLLIGDIRDFINLVNNPGKLGTKVKLHGNLEAYFGIAGLKATDNMVAEGYEPAAPGVIEVCGDQTTVNAGYKYDFNAVSDKTDFAEAGWQNVMIQGSRKWQGKLFEGNGYVQATAHGATADQIQESWIISPAFDVTAAAVKMASFETAQAYWKDDTKFEVYVLQCKDGKTVQTKVTPSALATSATPNYQFVPGTVDLSGFTGKVFIGFRYEGMGGMGLSTTWCVDNFGFGVAPAVETTVSITSSAVTSVTTGAAYNYAVKTNVVNASGNTVITATGLPTWATFVDNGDGTATISGTAPATEGTSNVVLKATNNNITAEQAYTLTVVAAVEPGANLVINGGFQEWTGSLPTNWITDVADAPFQKLEDASNFYVSLEPAATTKLYQFAPVVGGKKYKLSWKYKATATKLRIWSGFTTEATTSSYVNYLTDSNTTDPLRTNNGYFPIADNFVDYTPIEFTVPDGMSFLRLEFRFYKGGVSALDDIELIEVK